MSQDWQWKVEYWNAVDSTFKLGSDNVWAGSAEKAIDYFRKEHDFDGLAKVLYRVTPVGPPQVFHWKQPTVGRWIEHAELAEL